MKKKSFLQNFHNRPAAFVTLLHRADKNCGKIGGNARSLLLLYYNKEQTSKNDKTGGSPHGLQQSRPRNARKPPRQSGHRQQGTGRHPRRPLHCLHPRRGRALPEDQSGPGRRLQRHRRAGPGRHRPRGGPARHGGQGRPVQGVCRGGCLPHLHRRPRRRQRHCGLQGHRPHLRRHQSGGHQEP